MVEKINKDLLQVYEELQTIQQQLEDINVQLKEFMDQRKELSLSVDALKEFKDLESDKEVLVPIVNGVFAKAKLFKSDKLIVNVGSNVLVEKSVENTIKLLEQNLTEIDNYINKLRRSQGELMLKFQDKQQQAVKLSQS